MWSDILLVKGVQASIWRFQRTILQSIHFICMNNGACFAWESIAYRSRLSAFDQKGLDWAHNVGLDSGYKVKIYLYAQKMFKGFQD